MPRTNVSPHRRTICLAVRHGRTDLNDPKHPKLRAWENPSLNRIGQFDAEMAARKLNSYKPVIVYSSDLARDTETAHIIAEELGNIPTEVDYDLRTANMGQWSGMDDDEEMKKAVLQWYKMPWIAAPGGESYNDFSERFQRALQPKLDLARSSDKWRPIIIVAHGRNLANLDEQYNQKLSWDAVMPHPGGIVEIWKDFSGEGINQLGETEPIARDI